MAIQKLTHRYISMTLQFGNNCILLPGRSTFLVWLICCLPFRSFPQANHSDSLSQLLHSGRVNKMSFAELYKIQSDNQKLTKELAIGFSEALMARNDLMAVDSLKCKAYLQAGSIYSKYGELDKAEKVFSQSLSIALANNYQALLISIYNAKGLYYARNNKDSLAIDYYTKSIQTAEQLKETKEVLKTYVNLTSLFLKRALLDKCISYGLNGLPMAEKNNSLRPLAGLSINIGTAYYRKKDYPSAIKYFRKSIDASSKIQDYEKMISAYANLCSVYTLLDQKDSAAWYSRATEGLLNKMDSPNELVQANSVLAKYYVTSGDYRKAINFANNALEVSKRTHIESLNGQDAYLVLYQAYKGLNNKDSALRSLEQYWALNEPRLLHEKDKAVVAVEQQFQQYKKEQEITLLRKDKAMGQTQRNSAIIVALLLAIAAFLFYNRFRLKKRSSDILAHKNREIEKQKDLIQASLGEKEILLREIHHRVKNNLQIISSLLNIQSEHIQDEQVLSSIQEGQSRVEAMSLIHQNLYQSEHLNNVDISNYLQQLTAYLSSVFSGERRSIQVNVETAHIHFDIDTAIPLGLIVNELVSNAYKYAFDKNSTGLIHIRIDATSITLLKKDRAMGQTQRNSAIIVALLLAIAAFLFYNRFRLKKRSSDILAHKNREIEKQKDMIQASLGEKEILLREIHHRVKNNLQIISSLLNIQSEHIQDEQVLSSIQEGQSRVEAMSLIHQNLYQSEHLNNVDISNYLQQLTAYLSNVFSGERRSIAVSVETAHINFDIDTAIPLGLIVNELVSNAYKYAFDKNSTGGINIRLQVADNGKGLPPGFDPEKSNTLGLKLVKILSRQLRGSFSSKSGNGTVFLVKFKDLRAHRAA